MTTHAGTPHTRISISWPISVLPSGTLSVEAIYQDRDQFAQLVREVAAPDVGRMGIEILSFTIKDVYDSVEYLESLGRAQTANVKRDADIGVAEANRDAGIRVRICYYINLSCNKSKVCFNVGCRPSSSAPRSKNQILSQLAR